MSGEVNPKTVQIQLLPSRAGWEVYRLPVSQFNIPTEECTRLYSAVRRIRDALVRERSLHHEAFIQLEQFEEKEARTIFAAHSKEWIPEIGLGVWPDRDPPAVWTKEEFRSAPPGERVRPLMYNVFQISTTPAARRRAVEVLFRFGAMMEILTSLGPDSLFEGMTEELLPPIQDPSYTCFSYYVPLLEAKTVTAAPIEQMERWCRGISVYIRQSFEDRGVLILSRDPIGRVIEALGAVPEDSGKTSWLIPDIG